MELKVGDTVKILDRVGSMDNYSPIYTNGMLEYAGTITTVKEINRSGSLRLANNNYRWDKKAVKLVNEDKYLHPSELKDGNFIKIWDDWIKFIYIFREYKDNIIYRYASFNLDDRQVNTESFIRWSYSKNTKITYATEEERRLLLDKLAEKGYAWDNFDKKLIEMPNIYDWSVYKPEHTKVSVNAVNPCYIPSHPKYGVFVDTDKEELNLFPTKRHYQLNFNY